MLAVDDSQRRPAGLQRMETFIFYFFGPSWSFLAAAKPFCRSLFVSAANERGDTSLLAAVGAGKLELAEMLFSKGANVEAVRMDGAGPSPWPSFRSRQSCSIWLSPVAPKDWNTKPIYLHPNWPGCFWTRIGLKGG